MQRRRTLDHALEGIGRRRVDKLDPPVRAALRLGAYQLGYLDGVPRYAAVNESVELVRRARLERAVPFANAVLRRLADELRPLLDGLPEETPAQAALKHSYPDWVADVWWRDLGADDARELMRTQNEPAENVVRLVRASSRAGPIRTCPVPGTSNASTSRLSRGTDLAAEPRLAARRPAVGSQEGERTLDVCAARSGKATQPEERSSPSS